MLADNGAKLSVKDGEGNTALHHACYEQKADIALCLAKAGADYKVTNNEGKTPLEAGPVEIGFKLLALKKGETE